MTGSVQRLKVKLKGGGPWGFRLQGGPGTGSPLTVSKVRRKSKAYNNLREGDLLLSVNGIPCENLTYDQVMAIADKTGSEFHLEVERKQEKVDNAKLENKSTVHHNFSVQPQKTTISNTMVKVTETKTMVTEKGDDVVSKKAKTSSNDTSSNQSALITTHNVLPSDEPKLFQTVKENGMNPEENEPRKSDITSDISSKTSAEITPSGEKFEKLETEKMHEKKDNKETTIIRADYEQLVKNRTTSSSPPIIPKDKFAIENQLEVRRNDNTHTKSISSELYEVHETEKTEVTTTKLNGNPSLMSDILSTIDGNKTGIAVLAADRVSESDLPFATPMSTVDTFTEIEEQPGSLKITKKKKMFSSSSFYEEPHAIYPTVEEQFEMAKKIAESLADDTNKKSKGANMFFKRAKRSTKWIHEGPEPSSESAPDTPEILPEYPYTELATEGLDNLKKFPKLKLVLDPRHPLDLASLRSTGHVISEHNVISPEVCHELVRDLESPVGKGGALFAKRKKKSSEWVVDEEKVKALMKAHERDLSQVKENLTSAQTRSLTSPWDTSLYGRSVSPLTRVNPDHLAETVIAAADVKRRDSIQMMEEPRFEACRSPIIPAIPAASYYDIYKARAPKGWSASTNPAENLSTIVTSPSPPYPQLPGHAEPFPSYSSLTTPAYARKYNFQNFNTLPRKWKPRN